MKLPNLGRRRREPAALQAIRDRRILKGIWGLLITGLVGANLAFDAMGTDNRWSHLVDRCLSDQPNQSRGKDAEAQGPRR